MEKDQVSVNARCFIKLSDPTEYPKIEPIDPTAQICIADLASKVKRVFPAISTDETRYMLMCVYFDFTSGMIVATDGFRLHGEEMEKRDIDPVALPRSAANLIVKHPGSGVMRISDTRISFDLAGGELLVRPMVINYPDWKGILEGFTSDTVLEFSTEQFLKVLEGVIPVTDASKSVVLSANGDLTIEALGEMGAYSWHIPCYMTGTPPVLTFNLKFLSDAIKAYSGDGLAVLRCQGQEHGPVLINDHAIVMPIRR
jgi:DNA polymerase III sliding clamp (beta) subunit (PCNA family)